MELTTEALQLFANQDTNPENDTTQNDDFSFPSISNSVLDATTTDMNSHGIDSSLFHPYDENHPNSFSIWQEVISNGQR